MPTALALQEAPTGTYHHFSAATTSVSNTASTISFVRSGAASNVLNLRYDVDAADTTQLFLNFANITADNWYREVTGSSTGTVLSITGDVNLSNCGITPIHPGTIQIDSSGTIGEWYLTSTDGIVRFDTLNSQDIQKSLLKSFMHRRTRSPIRYDTSRSGLNKASVQELKARSTLRDLLTEKDWRRYVTNGFIMVRGASGKWYQVFNARHERVRVYEQGKLIESLCVHTDASCPPTDHVINMKVLIELDENEIYGRSNRNRPIAIGNTLVGAENQEEISLVAYYEKIKKQVMIKAPTFTNRESHGLAC